MQRLREPCAILPIESQVLFTRLRMMEVSDNAFTVALVMVQMLDFEMEHAIKLQWLCERTRLTLDEVKALEVELVAPGAVKRRRSMRGVRRMDLYRLAMP